MDPDKYAEDLERIASDYTDPSEVGFEATVEQLKEADFGNPEEVAKSLLTRDDIGLDADTAHQDGVTTREQVEKVVDKAEQGGGDDRREAVLDAVAEEVGAPSEDDLRQAEIQTVGAAEVTTAADLVEGETRTSQLSVVRSDEGDAVAVLGGGGSVGEDVAEELDATHFGSPDEYTESLSAEASDGRANLTLDGEKVGEVDV